MEKARGAMHGNAASNVSGVVLPLRTGVDEEEAALLGCRRERSVVRDVVERGRGATSGDNRRVGLPLGAVFSSE